MREQGFLVIDLDFGRQTTDLSQGFSTRLCGLTEGPNCLQRPHSNAWRLTLLWCRGIHPKSS